MPTVPDEPNMSDTTILVTVEDLINRAMGLPNANVVDFKLVQMILEILAKQQRMLQQRVEIRVIELTKELSKKKIAQDVASERPRLIEPIGTVKQQPKSPQRHKNKNAEKDAVEVKDHKNGERKKEEPINISQKEKDRLVKEKNKGRKEKEAEKTAHKEKVLLENEEIKARNEEQDRAEKLQKKTEKERLDKEEIKARNELEKAGNLARELEKGGKKMGQNEYVTLEKEDIGDISKLNPEKIRRGKDQEKKDKAMLKKTAGSSGIEISEKQMDNEKILVVEKGPTTRLETRFTDGIDFVTRSQFELLEADVKELSSIAVSKRLLPPEYDNLLSNLMKSEASLHTTMQTLQVDERMKSAEKSIAKIIELLTLLAVAGALPEDIAKQVETILPPPYEELKLEADKSRPMEENKSVTSDAKVFRPQVPASKDSHDLPLQPSFVQSVAPPRTVVDNKLLGTDTKSRKPQAGESQTSHDLNMQVSITPIQSRSLVEEQLVATDTKARRPQAVESQTSHGLNLQVSITPIQAQSLVEEQLVATDTKARRPKAVESQTSHGLNLQVSITPIQSQSLVEEQLVATDTKARRPQAVESQTFHGPNLQSPMTPIQSAAQPRALVEEKPVTTDNKASKPQAAESQASDKLNLQQSMSPKQPMSKPSETSMVLKVPCVTNKEMRDALKDLKDDITKILNTKTNKISAVAEAAQNIVEEIGKGLNVAQQLDSRISALYSLMKKYVEQLSGFTTGIDAQMKDCADLIAEMRETMENGLLRLKDVHNSAETAAIMKIIEQCLEMDNSLSTVINEKRALTEMLALLRSDMSSLLKCSQMMREEKVNRDELLNGLTYKADMLQLAGILKGVDFEAARADFEQRLDQSHERFHQSVAIWAAFIKDLKYTKNKKVDLVDLLAERDAAQQQLQNLDKRIRIVTDMLGDPKIATTARMSVDATCGSCHEPAWMEPYDVTSGAPPRLPPLRQTPEVELKEPYKPDWVRTRPSVPRHICRRWCGGSHTMAAISSNRIKLHLQMQAVPTRKFTEYGDDGRLYLLEEELQPCIECNVLDEENTIEQVRGSNENDLKPAELERAMNCICPLNN